MDDLFKAGRRVLHRRRAMHVAGVAIATVLVMIVAYSLQLDPVSPTANASRTSLGVTEGETTSAPQEQALNWTAIAPSPLSPRHGAVGVWIGKEMLVVGGSSTPPCPPTADCAGSLYGTLETDGAAYDPESNTWRALAPLPRAIESGIAVWSGTEMVIVANATTLAYDPQRDSWRVLDNPPQPNFNQGVATDHGLVFGSYDRAPHATTSPDWLLDTPSGTWSPLPADPYGESYDRSLAWDGQRLWLLSMSVGNHFEAFDGAASRVAVLEDDQWRTVSTTPPLEYGQGWWWFQGRLVAPVTRSNPDSHLGAYVAPGSTDWSAIPAAEPTGEDRPRGCPLPPAGAGTDWLAGGGPVLTSIEPLTTILVPPCKQFAQPDLAIWTGTELIVWGGPSADYQHNLDVGLTWAPPVPRP